MAAAVSYFGRVVSGRGCWAIQLRARWLGFGASNLGRVVSGPSRAIQPRTPLWGSGTSGIVREGAGSRGTRKAAIASRSGVGTAAGVAACSELGTTGIDSGFAWAGTSSAMSGDAPRSSEAGIGAEAMGFDERAAVRDPALLGGGTMGAAGASDA